MVDKKFHYRWDFIGLSTDTKPTPATSEKVVNGSTFYCSDNSKLYVWYKDQWYERTASGGGGSGTSDFDELTNRPKYNGTTMTGETDIPLAPTVVQTAGSSTTDVMSQNAVTGMVFADPTTQTKIKIGSGTSSEEGDESIEIGHNASATKSNCVAIGYGAEATKIGATCVGMNAKTSGKGRIALGAFSGSNDSTTGVMFIGTSDTSYGYNNTNYRLISGVHDGQTANDAVTVGQINGLIDAINTAMSTNIPHIGA